MAVERANALVSAVLSGLLKRKRSIAAALMYILALGRDVRANCWDLPEKAGLEPGDGRFHRLLERYRWSWERGRETLPRLAHQPDRALLEILIELPARLCHRPSSLKAMCPRYEGKPRQTPYPVSRGGNFGLIKPSTHGLFGGSPATGLGGHPDGDRPDLPCADRLSQRTRDSRETRHRGLRWCRRRDSRASSGASPSTSVTVSSTFLMSRQADAALLRGRSASAASA
jgi:hypothetical protein